MPLYSALTTAEHDGLVALAIVLVAGALAFVLQRIVFSVLAKLGARHENGFASAMVRRAKEPSELVFPLVAVELAVAAVNLPASLKEPLERILGLCIIAAVAWAVVALIELATALAKRRYRLDAEDNLHARQAETRLDILNRSATTLVLIVAVAIALMTFPPIRAIGTTLLASAGLVGLAVGFAARPFFENLVAGLQIALTQPIRIDDVVVVGTDTGRIEKITSTFVVVRLWDLRRLVVPLTYFLSTPFQNWTYSSANLTGSVVLPIDYAIPVAEVRAEVERILARTPLWDRRVGSVAVTDAKEASVELTVLVSAGDSSRLFELRSFVRERLVEFLRERAAAHAPPERVPAGVA